MVADPELLPLLDLEWPALNHHAARTHLEHLGWATCGQGDWAYAHRSSSGRLLARVSPFEPAYEYFVELCRRCAGNRYIPRIGLSTPLEGGGHLAVLEYLGIPDKNAVEEFLWWWGHPEEADTDLRTLRREVDAMHEWGRRRVRWWGPRVDVGDRHVLLSADGNPKLIDLFFVESAELIKDLIADPHAFARYVPVDQCRYLLDMPDLREEDQSPDYLGQIRAALNAQTAAASHRD